MNYESYRAEELVTQVMRGRKTPIIVADAKLAKQLVFQLEKQSINYSVANLPCGVKKFLFTREPCPECGQ